MADQPLRYSELFLCFRAGIKQKGKLMVEKIGFIGLGVLGSAMAPNLIESGFQVIGYDIRPKALQELELLGMQIAKLSYFKQILLKYRS